MKIHVGNYQLGWRYVDLYLTDGSGGSFDINTGEKTPQHASMEVSYRGSTSETFEILAHEAFEAAATLSLCRFKASLTYVPYASDNQLFVMDHNQMSEITAQVGNFIWQVYEDLHAAIALLKEA